MDAAVLIDWENFFWGREHNCSERGMELDISDEVERLVEFSRKLVAEVSEGARVAVWRAYADFNVWRAGNTTTGPRNDYFLQRTSAPLMRNGIEPVQVFTYPGGKAKNAADMRLTVDGLRLRSDDGIGVFLIVSGDADFIPLALDLRRMGARVIVLGVRGTTKEVLQRFVDRFEYFEDMTAAAHVDPPAESDLERVGQALLGLFDQRPSVVFAAVRPMLNKALGGSFDPSRFGQTDTGDFLRAHAERFGIGVRRAEHDWEIFRIDGEAPAAKDAESDSLLATSHATRAESAAAPQRASLSLYRRLLASRLPRFFVLTPAQWRSAAGSVFEALGDEHAAPTAEELMQRIEDDLEKAGIDGADKAAQAAMFQLLHAKVFVRAEDRGALPESSRATWTTPLAARDPLDEGSGARWMQSVAQLVVRELATRARSRAGGPMELVPELVAELVFGEVATEVELADVLGWLS